MDLTGHCKPITFLLYYLLFSRNTSGDNKKKQHICHMPGCGKVYGKTSHLRAHLRYSLQAAVFIGNLVKAELSL